ncbi:pentapeptide repeat-containing protein [Nonomuraea sp. NPDC005650]|uniref:pentapeptide repeat-containing protein n=1 Tax=Nonomuraea sp. NPDC005650 TaxID=3157045 RepID=UPI0033B30673
MSRFEDRLPRLPGHPVRTDKIPRIRTAWRYRVSVPFVFTALIGLVTLACALFLPRYVLAWDLGTAKPPDDYAAAVNDIRTALLQGVGGLVLLIGAYLTWRQLKLSRHGQATESFAAAITHLGDPSLDVRLGGIYALERISRTSPADRRPISEILSSFVGNRTRDPQRNIGHARQDSTPLGSDVNLSLRAPDVHAALIALGRRDPVRNQVLHLDRLDLPKANLASTRLRDADLHFSNLAKASLIGADLTRVDLSGVRLAGANLIDAVLYQADLRDAVLSGAIAEGVDLRGTDLTRADLRNANLRGARMDYADLRETALTGADLAGASLKRVVFDEKTEWPEGFDTSRIKPTRRRNLPPISPRDYDEFAVPTVAAKNGQPPEPT